MSSEIKGIHKPVPDSFDNTMISCFLECRYKYYLRHVLNIVPNVKSVALDFGTVIHFCLDMWYTSGKEDDKVLEYFEGAWTDVPGDEKRTKLVGNKMLRLYFNKYRNESFDMLESERVFNIAIDNFKIGGRQKYYMGRIDKIIDWNGVIYVLDHKTTSEMSARFFHKIKPNSQFDGYIWAARRLGYPNCSGIVMDALLTAKGLTQPSQLAKLKPLGRDISERTDEDIDLFEQELKQKIMDIYMCYKFNNFYRITDACGNYTGCPYRPICREDKDIQQAIIDMDYTYEIWNPLN